MELFHVSGNVLIDGNFNDINLSSKGTVNFNSKIIGYDIPDFKWQIDLFLNQQVAHGSLHTQQGDFKGDGNYKIEKSVFTLEKYIINAPSTHSKWDLIYDYENSILQSKAMVDSDNIVDFRIFFPSVKKGKVLINALYSVKNNKHSTNIDTVIDALQTSFLTINSANLNFNSNDVLAKEVINFNVNASNILRKDLIVKNLNLVAKSYDKNVIDTKLVMTLSDMCPTYVEINNRVFLEQDRIKGVIDQMLLTYDNNNVTNIKPIKMTKYNNQIFEINADEIKVNDGSFRLNGLIKNKKIDAEALIFDVPATVFDYLWQKQNEKSKINGSISLSGSLMKPIINLDILINCFFNTKSIDNTLIVKGEFNNSRLKVNSKILHNTDNISEVKLDLPFELTLFPFNYLLIKDKKFHFNYLANPDFDILSLVKICIRLGE